MINEEKVKHLYQLALYDQSEEKRNRQTGRFFRKDYIFKEIIKSFFSGTIVYILVLAMWGLYQGEALLDSVNTTDFLQIAVVIGLCYLAYMAVYLLVTYLIYHVRFTKRRRQLKRYYGRLRVLDRIYEREDKLKL